MRQLYAASELFALDSYGGNAGNYLKAFLINPDTNYNGWQATREFITRTLKEWIGRPIIEYITYKRTHPEYSDYDLAIRDQEQYKVGTIIDAGLDSKTDNFWAVAEIHDDDVYAKINSKEIRYVSPSVFPKRFAGQAWPLVVTDGHPVHLALVDDPAYGRQAKIVGTCSDSLGKCRTELEPLVADTGHAGTVPLFSEKISNITKDPKPELIMPEEAMQKRMKELSAEIDEIKKTVSAMENDHEKKTESAMENDHEKKTESAMGDDHEKKTESANDDEHEKKGMNAEEKEELKELKTQNASLLESAKRPIIDRILTASKVQGATEEQIKKQAEFLDASDLEQVQNFESNFIKPFITYSDAAMQQPQVPDISQVGASALGADTGDDDNTILREAGLLG